MNNIAKRIIVFVILGLALLANTAFASELQNVSNYLNKIKTLHAVFVQKDVHGVHKGIIYIQRPGKMRIVYNHPCKYLIVANGKMIAYVDLIQHHVTYLPVNTSPAQFFLQKEINFSHNIDVKKIFRMHGVLNVIIRFRNVGSGVIDLQFREKPLQLISWVVLMPNNQQVSVMLSDVQINTSLAHDLFKFKGSWQLRPHNEE